MHCLSYTANIPSIAVKGRERNNAPKPNQAVRREEGKTHRLVARFLVPSDLVMFLYQKESPDTLKVTLAFVGEIERGLGAWSPKRVPFPEDV